MTSYEAVRRTRAILTEHGLPDAAFEALLGHAIPEDKPHIDQTMTLGELNHKVRPNPGGFAGSDHNTLGFNH